MKVNQLKFGVVLSYTTIVIGYIISLVYTPIMLNLIGQSEYGLYSLVSSVIAYLGLLNFGFGSAYIRYYSKYKNNEDQNKIAKLNALMLIIFIVISIIAVAAGVILALNTQVVLGKELTDFELQKAKKLMLVLVINLAFSFPNIVFNSYILANEKFVFQNLLQLIKTIINPFLTLPLLLFGYGSVGMVVVTTLINVLISIINARFCITKLKMKFVFCQFDFILVKELATFSSFIFINMIVDQINWNIDKIILGRLYGTTMVAIYGVSSMIFTYYMSLSAAISNVFIPRVHSIVAKNNGNNDLNVLMVKVGRVQLIMLGLISSGIVLFGKQFLQFWVGSNYQDSYPILIILILSSTIPLIQGLGIEIQRAKNMHKFRSMLYLVIAIFNLLLSIPLSRIYGGVGAALATAIAQVIGNTLIMNVYYHKKIGIDIFCLWNEIFKLIPSISLSIIIGVLLVIFLNITNLFMFLFCVVLYTIIYCISLWCFGMNDFEKQLLTTAYNNLIKRKHVKN